MLIVGGDETTKVGVSGDSSGALIAASICQAVKDLDFQVEISFLLLPNSISRCRF